MRHSSPESFIRPRFGRHGPRSRKGCSTCRTRKVKCDEQHPQCLRCTQSRVKCEWNLPPKPRRRVCQPSEIPRGESASIRLLPSLASIDYRDDEQDVEEITYSAFSDYSLALMQYTTQTPLFPTLSTSHIPLSNSLKLEVLDWECFQHIPKSFMVLALGKPWRWSMLSYIHSKIAMQEPGVMRGFIAVASMELRSKDMLSPDERGVQSIDKLRRARRLQHVGMNNYYLTINELSSILKRASKQDRTDEDLDALFAMWFLILTFEQYGPDLVENTHIHLSGIHTFIARALEQGEYLHLPPASQQLLHFLCHYDANLALSNRRGGYLFHSLLAAPSSSGINREHLFEESRTCLPRIWGSDYPEEEILDDFENYRGLSLLQIATNLKVEVWRLGVAVRHGTADGESMGTVWRKIENVEKDFFDVLSMARLARTSHNRRVVVTVYHAALEYYGVRVLFACIPGSHLVMSSNPTFAFQHLSRQHITTSSSFVSSSTTHENQNQTAEARPPWLDATLTTLLSIAHKSLDANPELIYRYIWPLCIAGVKTRDPIHRDWIAGQVKRAGVLMKITGVPVEVVGNSMEWDVSEEGMLFLDEGGAGSVFGLLE